MGKKKSKKVKKSVVFDDADRIEFVTGFKKRKDERRAKAQAIKDEQLKEARRAVKQKRRDELKKLLVNSALESEHLNEYIEPVKVDLEDHVVTITSMDLNNMAGSLNVGMGTNKSEYMNSTKSSKESEN